LEVEAGESDAEIGGVGGEDGKRWGGAALGGGALAGGGDDGFEFAERAFEVGRIAGERSPEGGFDAVAIRLGGCVDRPTIGFGGGSAGAVGSGRAVCGGRGCGGVVARFSARGRGRR